MYYIVLTCPKLPLPNSPKSSTLPSSDYPGRSPLSPFQPWFPRCTSALMLRSASHSGANPTPRNRPPFHHQDHSDKCPESSIAIHVSLYSSLLSKYSVRSPLRQLVVSMSIWGESGLFLACAWVSRQFSWVMTTHGRSTCTICCSCLEILVGSSE